MLKRLLTCFAILTGLAATGAPLHAYQVEAMATEIERHGSDAETPQNTRCEYGNASALYFISCDDAHNFPVATTAIVVPAVLIGIDRSYQ